MRQKLAPLGRRLRAAVQRTIAWARGSFDLPTVLAIVCVCAGARAGFAIEGSIGQVAGFAVIAVLTGLAAVRVATARAGKR